MNFLNVFEQRVGSIFGDAGPVMPFSFKKLAKQVARELESETFIINDRDTAPALYTILVSPSDDEIMRPFYTQITAETAQFVEGQAQNKGYSFVGRPLVRFMVDPSLRAGKFSVFAENIDTTTLNNLRIEEEAFLSGAALGVIKPLEEKQNNASVQPKTIRHQPAQEVPAIQDFSVLDESGTFDVPNELSQEEQPQVLALNDFSQLNPSEAGLAVLPALRDDDDERVADASGSVQTNLDTSFEAQDLVPENSCMLIDRESGRTYTITAPGTVIGRERNAGGIVLKDPNISRRHAEISFDGNNWHIVDLNSTNGTLVNDVDVDEIVLHDKDQITFGLIVLEFREN